MLQTLRDKQKPLLYVVFALIVLCFGFLFTAQESGGFNFGGGDNPRAAAYIGSSMVDQKSASEINSQFSMLLELGYSRNNLSVSHPALQQQQALIRDFLGFLSTVRATPEQISEGVSENTDYVLLNWLAFREQTKAAGIAFREETHAEQISVALTQLPALRNFATGAFDKDRLATLQDTVSKDAAPLLLLDGREFRLTNYGPSGTMSLVREAVADLLTFAALKKSLEPAWRTNGSFAQRTQKLLSAQTQARVVQALRDDFLPTDEEVNEVLLRSWYEQNSAQFNLPETRKVQLLIGKVKPVKPEEDNPESEDLLSEDTKALISEKVTPEQWQELFTRYTQFYNAVLQKQPLLEQAQEAEIEVLEIAGVNQENPPELFAQDQALLNLALNANPNPERIAEPLQEESKGRIVSLRVLEVTPPQARPLEEVRERAVAAWKKVIAEQNMRETLKDAAAAMETYWQEQGKLDGFELADERLNLSAVRYYGGQFPSMRERSLDFASRMEPVGKTTDLVALEPVMDSQTNATSPSQGFAFITARRLSQENLDSMTPLSAEQRSAPMKEVVLTEWLIHARSEHEVRWPKIRVR